MRIKGSSVPTKGEPGLDSPSPVEMAQMLAGPRKAPLEVKRKDFRKGLIEGRDLRDVTFTQCRLTHQNFGRADLSRTRFVSCDLSHSDLSGCSEVTLSALETCWLVGAELPEDMADLDATLAKIDSQAGGVSKMFTGLLLVYGYTFLTNATVSDAGLFTSQVTARLPVLSVDVATTSFYIFAPFVVFLSYAFFHLQARPLWASAGSISQATIGGHRVGRRLQAWTLSAVICPGYGLRRRKSWMKIAKDVGLATFLGWGLGPICLVFLLGKAVKSHESGLELIHFVLTGVATFWAFLLYRSMHRELLWNRRTRAIWQGAGFLSAGLCLVFLFVLALTELRPAVMDPMWKAAEGIYQPYPDLADTDLSGRPASWSPKSPEDMLEVRPFRLPSSGAGGGAHNSLLAGSYLPARRDLRYANAASAFLVRAQLEDAFMPGINLERSDARSANFEGANMDGAMLSHADLTNSNLRGANLHTANLESASLRNADLTQAKLSGAHLTGADLEEGTLHLEPWLSTDFHPVRGERIDFERADLSGVKAQRADFRDANLSLANLHGANLAGVDLVHSQLANASATTANFDGAALNYAQLNGADFSYAHLADAKLCNTRARHIRFMFADLRRASLRDCQWDSVGMIGADVDNADASHARIADGFFQHAKGRLILQSAVLGQCRFEQAHLRSAVSKPSAEARRKHIPPPPAFSDFSGARVFESDFSFADLAGSRFVKAKFFHTDFTGAWLSSADLSHCYFYACRFSRAHVVGVNVTGCHFIRCEGWSALPGAIRQSALLESSDKDLKLILDFSDQPEKGKP